MEFEIVGFRKGNDGKDLTVCKKNVYIRILIRNKQVMDKYSPKQFEVVGLAKRGGNPGLKIKTYTKSEYDNYSDLNAGPTIFVNGKRKILYSRILIRNKHPQKNRKLI